MEKDRAKKLLQAVQKAEDAYSELNGMLKKGESASWDNGGRIILEGFEQDLNEVAAS